MTYDVTIAGGGLAGLTLALQLTQSDPRLRVLLVEKDALPHTEAAHKVGESSVEMGSHYFRTVLGLDDELCRHMPKFGLRFFFTDGDNRDITTRLECGPGHFLFVPSFNIDRGRFENALTEKCVARGVDVRDGCRVTAVAIAPGGGDHRVTLQRGAERREVRCRWIVDATGRAGLLRKKLGVGRPVRHDINAAWFRLDCAIDPDGWSHDGPWRARLAAPRRLSTNHLMGPGYWVWLIPLMHGRTSVGIVADARLHPFGELHTFEKAMAWLARHEPQCAAALSGHVERRMDFLRLKHFSHGAGQVFGAERWGLTGEAGTFVDPLYSPGSDFIGMANGFICDLIRRDRRGEDIAAVAAVHDRAYRALFRTFLVTYEQQYPIMGNGYVMALKIVWDFVMYWGGVALLFCRGKLCDVDFMARARPVLTGFALTNVAMQAFLRRWARSLPPGSAPGRFLDYAEIDFLRRLNRDLLREHDDEALLARLARNLEFAKELQREIEEEAAGIGSRPRGGRPPAGTAHLAGVLAVLRPATPAARVAAS
jgi:flavin-dependent dehydrogenase